MSGQSPVGTFALTNVATQAPSPYFPNNDGNWATAARAVDQFAPHPASPAAMSVVIDAGFVDAVTPSGQQTVTEVALQTVTIGAAPASPNNRIDLVAIDAGTGVASVIAGTPASSPSAPALTPGKRQICQVSVPNGTSAIAAGGITDLRAVWGHFARGIPFCVAGGSADALTGTFTPATPTLGASTDGYLWRVRATAANVTTTPTWAPDKLGGGTQGPWTIKKQNGQPLIAGDIGGAAHELLLTYNYNGGTPFIDLLDPQGVQSVNGQSGIVVIPNVPTGTIVPTGAACGRLGVSAPAGYLWFNGQAVSRTTYATLFDAICPSATCTISIASPGIVTLNNHGFLAGDPVAFETTGALPTGIVADTTYYVVSPTTNSFEIAATVGGAAINTSGSQSGTQTCFYTPYSTLTSTTFTVGDGRGRGLAGADTMGGSAAGRLGSGATGGIIGPAVPGATGGEQSHVLTDLELSSAAWADASPVIKSVSPGSGISLGLPGGAPPGHNNMPPTIVANFIIKT